MLDQSIREAGAPACAPASSASCPTISAGDGALRLTVDGLEDGSTSCEVFLNLRNRLIWIAALTVAFATVQFFASQRNAKQARVEDLKDKLLPLATQCVEQAQEPSRRVHGALTLQLSLVPDGKLRAIIEHLEVPASSQVQESALAACIRERAKTLTIQQTLPSGPEQIELTLQI
jgi:hypothetical protein